MTELLESTALTKPTPINWELLREQSIASFDIQREAIAVEVAADTLLMVRNAVDRKAANERRMVWVRRRTALERTRKVAQADAKKIVSLVSKTAETFQTEFSKAEDHLASQVDAWDAKIEAETKEKADAAFNAKNSQLLHVGIVLDRMVVELLTDERIQEMIDDKLESDCLREAETHRLAQAKAEADRLAAELAEANRLAAEQLAADRAEFARMKSAQQAELDAQRALIEAAQEKINASAFEVSERERLRSKAEAKVAADAFEAERLSLLADKAAEEMAEQINREFSEREEARKRAEQLKPDRERLRSFADAVQALEVPMIASANVRYLVATEILSCCEAIRFIAVNKLV